MKSPDTEECVQHGTIYTQYEYSQNESMIIEFIKSLPRGELKPTG